MDEGSLLILTGPPGAGKTTVGKIIASQSSRSACISADWFWTTIVNGHVPPWERAADDQNRVMISSAVAASLRMAKAGYAAVLEGILGPRHFDQLRAELVECRVPVHYVVLRPRSNICLTRAQGRVLRSDEHRYALTEEEPIRHMWLEFSGLGSFEDHVIDTSGLDVGSTVHLVSERIGAGTLRFPSA